MFLAGIEYNINTVKGRASQAGVLGLLSVGIPALLGFPLAQIMFTPQFAAQPDGSMLPFALIIGAALTVTAFPVMAHILMEREQLNTSMGSLAVATAAIISVLMFTYIAVARAVAEGGAISGLLLKIGGIVLFGIVAWFVIRPFLTRILNESLAGNSMAIIFGGMILFGLIAEYLGLNSLVGGFVWGLILPQNPELRQKVAGNIRHITLTVFLPIFFAQAGFAADMKLLTSDTIVIALLVLIMAVVGKFVAALPARRYGLTWKEVGTLGALFNTRGLLVLVVGLIGLQLNIITESTFAITVLVALVTNLMTLPLLNVYQSPQPQQ
jgi:Kef-type K+ transport system membrane component KefB